MSSDESDTDLIFDIQMQSKILNLLQLRRQPRNAMRRLYDEASPIARRSLNVQKLTEIKESNVAGNRVCQNIIKDMATTSHSQARAQEKRMICSTPNIKNSTEKFTVSLSPIELNRSPTEFVETVLLDRSIWNTNKLQPQVVLTDVRKSIKRPYNLTVQDERVPSLTIKSSAMQVGKSQTERDLVNRETLLRNADLPGHSRTMSTSITTNREIPISVKTFSSSDVTIAESNQRNSKLSSNQLLSKPTSEFSGTVPYSYKSPRLENSKIRPTNVTISNSKFLNYNNKTSNALTLSIENNGPNHTVQLSEKINVSACQNQREQSDDGSVDMGIQEIQGDQNEIENGISIRTLGPDNFSTDLQSHRNSPSLHRTATPLSLITPAITNTQEACQKRKESNKRSWKNKNSDSYQDYLNLEELAKRRKSSVLGSKRKLYTSGGESMNLEEARNSESLTQNQISNKNDSVIATEPSAFVIDSDGFKIPNTLQTGPKLPRKRTIDESVNVCTPKLAIIAENIQILNKSHALTIPDKTTEIDSSLQGGVVKPMKNKPKSKQPNKTELPVRRSNRTKNEPMTFWKVNKQTIAQDNAEFYAKVFFEEAAKSKPEKKQNNIKRRPRLAKMAKPTDETQPDAVNTQEVELGPIPSIAQSETVVREDVSLVPDTLATSKSVPDSGLQTSIDSDIGQYQKFLKIPLSNGNSITPQTENDFLLTNNLTFHEFMGVPGLQFAFVPRTKEMIGFIKLLPGVVKEDATTSRNYYLNLMLVSDTKIIIQVDQQSIEMAHGEMDSIQLGPKTRYGLFNNSKKEAIIMSVRTPV